MKLIYDGDDCCGDGNTDDGYGDASDGGSA